MRILTKDHVQPLPLVFDPPRRAMPPRHLADLDEAGRAEPSRSLGCPRFAANNWPTSTTAG